MNKRKDEIGNGTIDKNKKESRKENKKTKKMKIIIDTDPGHDDALAIMLAVKSEMFDILAITTVAGNSTIENTTRNGIYILDLLGRSDIPIYSGSKKPLKKQLINAVVHGESGLDGIDPKNKANITGNAVEKIIQLAKENKGITIVTLGPLTNIAKAILKNPKIMSTVGQIIIMGGAINVAGNKNRVAEFNIFVDPDAANTVFEFPINKTIVPLDACNDIRMSLEDFKNIQNEKLRKPIIKMMKLYIRNIFLDEGVNAALMYDPLTVFYLLKPKNCTTKEYNIQIETKGDITRGMTVADLRMKKDAPPNVTVVEKISESEFKRYFIKTLSR